MGQSSAMFGSASALLSAGHWKAQNLNRKPPFTFCFCFKERLVQYAKSNYGDWEHDDGDVLDEEKYTKFNRVAFVAVVDKFYFSDSECCITHHDILGDFVKLTVLETEKFTLTNFNGMGSNIAKWCYFFKHAATTKAEDLKKIAPRKSPVACAIEAVYNMDWTMEEMKSYHEAENHRIGIPKKEMIAETRQTYQIAKRMIQSGVDLKKVVICTELSGWDIDQFASHLKHER